MKKKRVVEVFVAGCPLCADAVKRVKALACTSCDVRVLDLRTDRQARDAAERYGVRRVPAVAVDGNLAECCAGGGLDDGVLRRAGLGQPS